MTAHDTQAARLDAILPWAELAGELLASVRPYEHGVHLRPSATGIRVIDLSPSRPQLDRGKLTRREGATEKLVQLMALPGGKEPERPTPERRLESWLIADAYRHQRAMHALSEQLVFVTDQQVIYDDSGESVCDLLAVRLGTAATPVAIELKSSRQMKQAVGQLGTISGVVNRHLDGFSRVFSALMRTEIRLAGPCERWLVWPETKGGADPRAHELRLQRIVVRGYRAMGDHYFFS